MISLIEFPIKKHGYSIDLVLRVDYSHSYSVSEITTCVGDHWRTDVVGEDHSVDIESIEIEDGKGRFHPLKQKFTEKFINLEELKKELVDN